MTSLPRIQQAMGGSFGIIIMIMIMIILIYLSLYLMLFGFLSK